MQFVFEGTQTSPMRCGRQEADLKFFSPSRFSRAIRQSSNTSLRTVSGDRIKRPVLFFWSCVSKSKAGQFTASSHRTFKTIRSLAILSPITSTKALPTSVIHVYLSLYNASVGSCAMENVTLLTSEPIACRFLVLWSIATVSLTSLKVMMRSLLRSLTASTISLHNYFEN